VLLFIVRRLAWAVVLIFVITLITFVIFLMLPAEQRQATGGLATPNLQAQFDTQGRSLPNQYVHFLDRVFIHGDLGDSMRQTVTVRHIIGRSLPVTISLVIGGTLMWMLLSFTIGVISALRPRSLLDKFFMTFVLIGVSAHPVWLGLLFSYTFGFRAHIFPIAGYCDFVYDPNSANQCGGPRFWAYHLVLPWFTFSLLFAALYARMIRASLLETMHEDWVRTAYGKGAGQWRVMRKHVMQNAMLPVVTMMGMDIALAFSGAIFIETVFELPGMGQVLYRALTTSDTPVIMGVIIVVTIAVVLMNMIVDILIALLDPRVGLSSTGSREAAPLRRSRPWGYRGVEVGESQEAQAPS
jgi:peptide/nickel transport system permease protein